jgi:L,D-peptidoglycan transpeptidase YkuD (ErfK/YbiS/YcfS/YnhG family)
VRPAPFLALCVPVLIVAACSNSSSSRSGASSSTPPAPPTSTPTSTTAAPQTSTTTSHRTAPRRASTSTSAPPTRTATPHRTPPAKPTTAAALPLDYGTKNATQVITVTAPYSSSTTATLQRWTKDGSGWRKVGHSVPAHLGSAGMSAHTNEGLSATPEGSFTLTQAFGHDANPGTRLPYLHTQPDDWWISQAGPLYNTHQRCASHCGFTQGDPNEHLYYETPYYNYAVVIDYNTRNSPTGVRQGAGSAFFLHVSVGEPTAGCVSILSDDLVKVLRWLVPSANPRILIGVA